MRRRQPIAGAALAFLLLTVGPLSAQERRYPSSVTVVTTVRCVDTDVTIEHVSHMDRFNPKITAISIGAMRVAPDELAKLADLVKGRFILAVEPVECGKVTNLDRIYFILETRKRFGGGEGRDSASFFVSDGKVTIENPGPVDR